MPELYLANDFGPDRLLHNRSTPGKLAFANLKGERTFGTPSSFVLGNDSFKGMGLDFADFNGDGLLDMYVSNLTPQFGILESHFLWLSTGQTARMKDGIAPYVQSSEKHGLSRSGWSWDCRLVDLNNDGVFEALQANGFLQGKVNRWPEIQSLGTSNPQLLHNPLFWPRLMPGDDISGHDTFSFFVRAKDGRYYDIADKMDGMAGPHVNRGIAVADVDADGRLDFAVANQWEPSHFHHNRSEKPGQFLGLNLVLPLKPGEKSEHQEGFNRAAGDSPVRPAIGATVTVRMPADRKLVAEVDGGSGFAGRRAPQVHFGLGDHKDAVPVDIRWRDAAGKEHRDTFTLKPGWHTIRLGAAMEKGANP
jgi:hypothetical protein